MSDGSGSGDEKRIWLQADDGTLLQGARLSAAEARVTEISETASLDLHDVVRIQPEPAGSHEGAPLHRVAGLLTPGGYRTYLAWALLRQPDEVEAWRARLAEEGIAIRFFGRINREVRQMGLALPETLSRLEALTLLNRLAQRVEIVCPLLAAHADEIDRAKADLDRAVGWGAPDPELSYAVAQALESQGEWDAAQPFWERLANAMPDWGPAHERLALNYAHLGVFPHAAAAFERAALLTDDPDHQSRLERARDLMWEQSRI